MDKYHELALFKFKIISPVLNDINISQKDYFKNTSKKSFSLPFTSHQSHFSPNTFKKWLSLYRKGGFDALLNSQRKDKGSFRSISPDIANKIFSLTADYFFKTSKNLHNFLIKENIISSSSFSYATLNSFVRKNNLFNPASQKKPRLAFESPHINQLWMVDIMYGPYVLHGKKKVKTFLYAIIDDFSRTIVSAKFFTSSSLFPLELTLKSAILSFGLPQKLYCDNAKIFYSHNLDLISARLGFSIIHSKPSDPASRGKIERFFRTVNDSFIPMFHIHYKYPLNIIDTLNTSFSSWLSSDYNNHSHSAIKSTPLDRFFADADNVYIKKSSKSELDPIFFHSFFRKVNNDSTISFNNSLFQVPSKYIGKKIEIRFDLQNPSDLFLFENNKQLFKLDKLDKHLNVLFPIKFNKEV